MAQNRIISNADGSVIASYTEVVPSNCKRCGGALRPDRLVAAVGPPFCMLVHRSCLPFFPYSNGWPHPLPYEEYDKSLTEHEQT